GVVVMQAGPGLGLGMADAGPYLTPSQNLLPMTVGPASAQSIGSVTSTGCVVAQTFGVLGLSDVYLITGEDVTITRTYTNNGTGTLHVANNTLPNLIWPSGYEPLTDMQEQVPSWWPAKGQNGYEAFNPSLLNRFGAWTAVYDGSQGGVPYGLGFNTGVSTTCQNAVTMDKNFNAATRQVNWLERVEIAPSGGTATAVLT